MDEPALDMPDTLSEHPLMPVVSAWMGKIRRAMKFKKDRFQNDADEALAFFECGTKLHEFMWDGHNVHGKELPDDGEEETPAPRFKVVIGKTAELVQRFGPAIYHNNPTIAVESKTIEIPDDQYLALIPPESMQMAQMQAQQQGQPFNPKSLIPSDPDKAHSDIVGTLMQFELNYMQRENDKKTHSRRFAEEALIKGMSVLWTEYTEPYPDGPKTIVSTFDRIDNFVFDPDAEQREKALWSARKKLRPVWEVARDYGIDLEYLKKRKGIAESVNSQEENRDNADYQHDKAKGITNDLIEVWEVWSKMGMGENLSNIKGIDGMEDMLRSFGDNVYLCFTEKVPYPLNLHHDRLLDALTEPDPEEEEGDRPAYDEAYMAVQWPIPFWEFGGWPWTDLAFRESPNSAWPMPYIKPAMGHLKFINWCMSFLVNKIRTACCTVVTGMKALGEEVEQRLLSGKDFRYLPIEKHLVPDGDITKAVHFLTMPPFHADIYKVLEAEMDAFDKATGLTSLMYGMPGGMRSSAEATQKSHNANAPLDDMASRMEDAMSLVARKEAMALRWISTGKDVQPTLGKLGAALWDQYVVSKDFGAIAREYHYRIEAGSTRKPNKDQQAANVTQAIQAWMPVLQWALGHGQIAGINDLMQRWAEANDFSMKNDFLQEPPPPQPSPEMLKIQAEIEGRKQESQIKQQEMQGKLQIAQQTGQMKVQTEQAKMAIEQRKAQMQGQTEMQKMALEREKAMQELQLNAQAGAQDGALADQDMRTKLIQSLAEMRMNKTRGEHEMAMQRKQGEHDMAIKEKMAAKQPAKTGGQAT